MASRTTLSHAMTPAEITFIKGGLPAKQGTETPPPEQTNPSEKTIDLTEPVTEKAEKEAGSGRRVRGRIRQAQPEASEILDQVPEKLSVSLRRRTAQALTRAWLELKMKDATVKKQAIVEEILSDWLSKNGYLD